MKIFIVGKHASGKKEILDLIEENNIKVGRECSNLPDDPIPSTAYIDSKYERYSFDDMDNISKQDSYIYLTGFEEKGIIDGYMYYKGLSFWTYDNAQVFSISPQYLQHINRKNINDHIVFIWLDNTRNNRIHRHVSEERTYSFRELEEIESRYDSDFVKNLYNFPNSSIIYFTDEVPERVATIVTVLAKHPELKDLFTDNFN